MTNDISSPLYRGPICSHRDRTFNTICYMFIPQAEKFSIIHSMIRREDTTTLRYDPEANTAEGRGGYCTTFETAVACGDYDIVKYLLQSGVNPNICGRIDLGPPLHVAIRNLDLKMVDILGNSGVANMNIKYKIMSPQTDTNITQQKVSAQNLVRRMKVPEELTGEKKEKWESDLEKMIHLVDYFVGRM